MNQPTIEWTDRWGTKHSMRMQTATMIMKELYDEWPGGLDEVNSSVESHRRLLADTKLALSSGEEEMLDDFVALTFQCARYERNSMDWKEAGKNFINRIKHLARSNR